MKSLLFLLYFTMSTWATADANTMQVEVLKKLPGASEDLSSKLMCLKNRHYPDDIEKCGLSGFPNLTYQKKIEDCLWSKAGVLVPLKATANGKYITAMLVVSCATVKVVAQFQGSGEKYLLVDIGELVD